MSYCRLLKVEESQIICDGEGINIVMMMMVIGMNMMMVNLVSMMTIMMNCAAP